jgi:hypothetical protein
MVHELDFYLNLITSEYKTKINFMTFLNVLLTPFNDINTVMQDFYLNFDIDSAVGMQLDMVGLLVGQSRTIPFQPTDGSSSTLDDVTYRTLLKAKCALNNWNGQASELEATWLNLFPDGAVIVQDNQDMSITIGVGGQITSTMRDLIRNGYIIPHPQGVKINVYFSNPLPLFAYGVVNQYLAGYGVGNWCTGQTEPAVFGYDDETTKIEGYDQGYWD